jgi:hypothetical protein
MELPGVRRKSYEDWPVTFMDPDKLDTAGFYYVNHGDGLLSVLQSDASTLDGG